MANRRKHSSITIDKNKIIQVISNLINNAVHYTEKGKITVQAKKENDNVFCSALQTPAQEPKESQQKIFTRLYQVDSPLTRKIGRDWAWIVAFKRLCRRHGGKYGSRAKKAKGTAFLLHYPALRSAGKERSRYNAGNKEKGFAPIDDATKKKIVEEYLAEHEEKQQNSAESRKIGKEPEISSPQTKERPRHQRTEK